MTMNRGNESKGMLSTFIGGTLWGVNGVLGSYLFLAKNVTTDWLIPYRLLFAGLLVIVYLYHKNGKKIFDILKNKKDLPQILLFSLIGMLGTQYTYFSAIQYSNAAIATVLTYFGPTLVLVYMCLKEKRKPLKYEIFAIALSTFGVFLFTFFDNFNLFLASSIESPSSNIYNAISYCLSSSSISNNILQPVSDRFSLLASSKTLSLKFNICNISVIALLVLPIFLANSSAERL